MSAKKITNIEKTIPCPHCNAEVSIEHILRNLSEMTRKALGGQLMNSLRKNYRGREKVIKVCGCGGLFTAVDVRAHHCPMKLSRGNERNATASETELYNAGAKNIYAATKKILGGRDLKQKSQ